MYRPFIDLFIDLLFVIFPNYILFTLLLCCWIFATVWLLHCYRAAVYRSSFFSFLVEILPRVGSCLHHIRCSVSPQKNNKTSNFRGWLIPARWPCTTHTLSLSQLILTKTKSFLTVAESRTSRPLSIHVHVAVWSGRPVVNLCNCD